MRYAAIVFVLILVNFTSCAGQQSEKELVVQTILNNSDINKFLHLDLKSQDPIFILENKYIDKSLNLGQINYQFISSQEAFKTNKDYLDFSPLNITGREAGFALYYSYENISIEGTLRKKNNNKWIVEDFEVFQF